MFKEAGDFANAEQHYLEADRLMPNDADLALQFGHFYKVAGLLDRSESAYRRALELRPHWSEPARELEQLGGRLDGTGWSATEDTRAGETTSIASRLVPELAPGNPQELRRSYVDGIYIARLGARQERCHWGTLPTLRGVQAIRGFCISSVPIVEFQIAVRGETVYKGPLRGQVIEGSLENQCKYVFNIWHDFSKFTLGRCAVELRFVTTNYKVRSRRAEVAIAAALDEEQFPECDTLISLCDTDSRSVEEQVNSRASVVRSPKRTLFPTPIYNVLVQRADHLGDMVCSIPALRRLRELLPNARIVGLLTSASAEFAGTLALFDEIVVVDFPDDKIERRRIMPLDKQRELRKRLEPYRFDLAIDLSINAGSRPLLLLSGAPFLYGFQTRDWPWLSAGFEANTHDPLNHQENVPTSNRILALIERLGTMLESRAEVVRRSDLARSTLELYGLAEQDRFAVLHTGAGLAFSRWPYFVELTSLLLNNTDLKVALLTDDPSVKTRLPRDLLDSQRFRLVEGLLPFDHLDTLLSFCTVFVGNDSGPKHLAALRGAKVVSLHSARLNWNEWGQEISGTIISRKVPCAGCGIHYDADECGKDFACIVKISPQEVYESMIALLSDR